LFLHFWYQKGVGRKERKVYSIITERESRMGKGKYKKHERSKNDEVRG